MRRILIVNAGRSAGENDSVRLHFFDVGGRNIEANDFRIDLAFPHTAGDHLRVLRAKIENENFRMGGRDGFHGGGG